jgi:hypothetical protein
MTVSLSMLAGAGAQFSDDNGVPLAGGLIYTYTAGTTTPVVTYQTSAGSGGSSNSNPIVLDSAGRVPYQIWLTDGVSYKFVLKTSGGSTVRTEDNLYGAPNTNPSTLLKVVATFADISAALATMTIGQQFSLLGHTVQGVGGGLFNVVSSSGLSADTGYTVINGALAAVRVDDYTNGINIENYGAKRVCANSGDATTNSNAFIAADIKARAVGSFVFLPLVYDINRLGNFTNFMRCRGAARDQSGLRVYWDGVSTFPYSGNSTAYLTSTKGALFENMLFDQQWQIAVTAHPGGYNDGAFASTWGGYWIGEFNTTDIVEFDNVRFNKTVRGFQTTGSKVKCKNVFGDTLTSAAQCLVAGDSSTSYMVQDCEVIGPRWDVEPLFGGYPLAGASAFFGHDVHDLSIDNLVMEGHQIVFRGVTKGGNSKRAVIDGLRLLSPVADTAFYFWDDLTISNVNIAISGDMGLALESNRRMTIGNININGTSIGGIAINDGDYISCTGPITIWNIAQNYARIKLFNRLASAAGPWLSLLSISFKSGAAAGVQHLVSNITAGFDTIPEVSDSNGPVRAVVFGIFVEPTTSATTHSYSINGVRVPDYRGSGLSSFMIFAPEHRFYLAPASRTGTAVLGEKFTNGVNSFIYLSDFGDGSYLNLKRLVGTIPGVTTFTGATSGATFTSAAVPQLGWLKVVATGNYDYTTEGADGR